MIYKSSILDEFKKLSLGEEKMGEEDMGEILALIFFFFFGPGTL